MNKKLYSVTKLLCLLSVLAILATQTNTAAGPTNAIACTDCTSLMGTCANGCPLSIPDPDARSQCIAQCVNGGTACQSAGGNLDCNAVYSNCTSGLTGSDIGSCFGNYATCGYTSFQRGFAMLQSPPPDDHPCFTEANDNFWLCVDSENTESPCNEFTGTTRYNCCAGIRDSAKTACLGL
jgi:hypothetical protein